MSSAPLSHQVFYDVQRCINRSVYYSIDEQLSCIIGADINIQLIVSLRFNNIVSSIPPLINPDPYVAFVTV